MSAYLRLILLIVAMASTGAAAAADDLYQSQTIVTGTGEANRKIGFLTHFIAYASVLTLILVSSGNFRATFIVAAAWGIGIAIHYFSAVVAPGLRQRMIQDEVGRGVARGVTRERRAAETRHERSLLQQRVVERLRLARERRVQPPIPRRQRR